jgi:preprotein translocase subunit SecD
VSFEFNGEGSQRFGDLTERLVGKQLAIVLDRKVESAPNVESPITGGTGQITGGFDEQEARDLALVLQTGALPVELEQSQVETVSATLGQQSLHLGLIAGVTGLILLCLYLAFYYRLLGIVTWFGMAIWAILALTIISLLGRGVGYSLTLAGIAGLVVSLGITADSYIVFYERLKDEVRKGKTVRAAVGPAFARAWKTIIAADIITISAAIILYMIAIGSVRGFALTLGLSTLLDMFVVYFFKRPLVFLIARSRFLSEMRGMGLRSAVAVGDMAPAEPVRGGSR